MAGRLPEPGTWTIDSTHSFVTFTVEHFTVALARGITAGPAGTIVIGRDLLSSSVRASIDVSTLTTANKLRDGKVLGPDVLDADRFPAIGFTARAARGEAGAVRARRRPDDARRHAAGDARPHAARRDHRHLGQEEAGPDGDRADQAERLRRPRVRARGAGVGRLHGPGRRSGHP